MTYLTEKTVSDAIGRAGTELEKLRERYRGGILTEDEGAGYVTNVLFGTFFDLLYKCFVVLRLTEDNYPAFTDEYNGAETEGGASSWLVRRGAEKTPASTEEKRLAIRLMKGLHIQPDHLEPAPGDIIVPNKHYLHSWNCCSACGIGFCCVDDGGLTEDPDPVGKTFLLKSDLGLTAELTVKEDRRGTDRLGRDFDESTVKAAFLAEGYIEGFTAKSERCDASVLIRLYPEGGVNYLAYYEYADDLDAFYKFPLWKDYFDWRAVKAERRRRTVLSLLKE